MNPSVGDLADRFLRFAQRAETSPLYRRLALDIANDDEVLRIVSAATSVPATLLLLAAVHYLLMDGADHPLRSFYRSLTRDPKSPDGATEFTLTRYRDVDKSQKLLALVDDHGEWIRWAVGI